MIGKRKRTIPILLAAALLLACVLGGASRPNRKISAEECYRRSAEAVLYLRSYYPSGSLKATGSGFILSEDGLVVTAAHVVKGGDRIAAVQADGTELALTLIQSCEDTDIALLRLPEGEYPALELAEVTPNTGTVVRAMGYPIKGTGIITEGLLSAQCAQVNGKDRMLVTCDIVNGMSGGPILDACGRVVGVVSGSVRTMDGIHLSVLSRELFEAVSKVIGTTEEESSGGAA